MFQILEFILNLGGVLSLSLFSFVGIVVAIGEWKSTDFKSILVLIFFLRMAVLNINSFITTYIG